MFYCFHNITSPGCVGLGQTLNDTVLSRFKNDTTLLLSFEMFHGPTLSTCMFTIDKYSLYYEGARTTFPEELHQTISILVSIRAWECRAGCPGSYFKFPLVICFLYTNTFRFKYQSKFFAAQKEVVCGNSRRRSAGIATATTEVESGARFGIDRGWRRWIFSLSRYRRRHVCR